MSYTIKLKNGCIKKLEALHGANLQGAILHDADLHDADLSDADLSDADLRGTNLRGADLHGANLREANLREANLRGADLSHADLRGADLHGADIDFSAWPLWCGSLGAKTDKRVAAQLLYHALDAMSNCTDACVRDMALRHEDLLELANSFHRVVDGDCVYLCAKTNKED
jgi:uncharacterized protein YjbI with pentapeptide repeats